MIRRYLIPAAWILSGLLVLAYGPGCGPITPEGMDRVLCLAQGGTWTSPYGPCVMEPTPPPPVEPPPPPPVVTPDGERACAPPEIIYECWNKPPGEGWSWIGPAPVEPPPPVTPPPVEPGQCPQGNPQAAGPTQNGRGFDGTPRVCSPDIYPVGADGMSCGLEGRRCIPLGCEGAANSPAREACETEVMGGPEPEWHIRVLSGDPRLTEAGWPARVIGNGTFEIWWCFPGHPAVCSKVLTARVPE